MPCNSNRPVDIQATHAAKFHARGFVLDVVAFEEPSPGQAVGGLVGEEPIGDGICAALNGTVDAGSKSSAVRSTGW